MSARRRRPESTFAKSQTGFSSVAPATPRPRAGVEESAGSIQQTASAAKSESDESAVIKAPWHRQLPDFPLGGRSSGLPFGAGE